MQQNAMQTHVSVFRAELLALTPTILEMQQVIDQPIIIVVRPYFFSLLQ